MTSDFSARAVTEMTSWSSHSLLKSKPQKSKLFRYFIFELENGQDRDL